MRWWMLILLMLQTAAHAQPQPVRDKINNLHHNSVECMMWFGVAAARSTGETQQRATQAFETLKTVIDTLPIHQAVTEARI